MEAIAALSAHRQIGIDTSVFIYLFEDSPTYGRLAAAVHRQVATGVLDGVTSAVTMMEIAVFPLKHGSPEVAERYVMGIRGTPNLRIIDIDLWTARAAAHLRAQYGTQPADALQIGACLHAGATAFVTNDKRLRTIRDLEIIVLDDFIH